MVVFEPETKLDEKIVFEDSSSLPASPFPNESEGEGDGK